MSLALYYSIYCDHCKELLLQQPDIYTESNFREKTSKEIESREPGNKWEKQEKKSRFEFFPPLQRWKILENGY